MINSSEWKEFRIDDIFDIECSKYHNPKLYNDGQIPYVARTIFNNGITQYIDTKEKLYKANCIIIGAESAKAFYQKKDFLTGNKIYRLYLKDDFKIKFNRKIALFICSIINSLSSNYNYVDAFVSSKIAIAQIKLPIKNNKPDFDFMENFIDKIEQKQRGILEFYKHKKQNGGGYELNSRIWQEFKIGDLFDIHPTKNYGLTNNDLFKTNGEIPVIVNSSFNNGVGNYVNLEPTEKGNIVTFSDTTTSESIFYQPRDFIGYSHVQGVYPFSSKWEEKTLLYFVAVFRKATLNRFDYANKFNRKIAKETNIKLPITANGEIDFDFMESFIKAIQKECIKGVDSYLSKNIATTKELIK